MIFEQIFFAFCAIAAIGGAIGTIAQTNPIRCAMALLTTIVSIAGMYLQLHAPFLAAIQLIVYAGAVVVLFIFVIMLIGPDATAAKDARAIVSRAAGGIGIGFVALQIVLKLATKTFGYEPPLQSGFGSIDAFGTVMFSDYLVPFEVSSFLLMVAIVGAVAVARGKQPDAQHDRTVALATKRKAELDAEEAEKKEVAA